jgi:hypothetical protein
MKEKLINYLSSIRNSLKENPKKLKITIVFVAVLVLAIILIFGIIGRQGGDIKSGTGASNRIMQMVAGEITEIDATQNIFTIDTDPLGKHSFYKITAGKQTKFFTLVYPQLNKEDESVTGTNEPEQKPADFGALKKGANVEVTFSKSINIDKAQKLEAQTVSVVEEPQRTEEIVSPHQNKKL